MHGIFPMGTNGEAYALSFQEKEEILATVIDQVKGRVPVYAGTGCITTAETIRLSKRAEELGADALSIITPSFALASQKELYDHYTAVAKAVNLPIILYNIPARTGNKLLPETVQALCRDVENIVGAKDSSGDIENLKAYIRLTRELDKEVAILAGNDGAILTCLKEGGAGGIAGRANIWPETVAKIYDCFKAGDLEGAQAAQDAIAILQQTFKYGNPNTIIKTAVALQGHPVGKCRAPFNYVPEEGMEAIKKVLDGVANSQVDEFGTTKPLIECVHSGVLRGAVAMVGCNNPKVRPDTAHIELMKKLLENDIILIVSGCSAQAAAKAGLMDPEKAKEYCGAGLKRVCELAGIPPVLHMGSCVDISRMMILASDIAKDWGIHISQVPVVGCAPEWMSEKAVSIGNYVVATGIETFLGVDPYTKGSEEVTALLQGEHGVKDWVEARFVVETDIEKLGDKMIECIEAKRAALGI